MYLFCVRHFNDIDHIAPVVWQMKKNSYPVAVYCINPKYDIENDYHLNFLKEQGITVELIYNAFDKEFNSIHRSLRFLFLWFFSQWKGFDLHYRKKPSLLLALPRLFAEITGSVLYWLTRILFYNKKWAHYFLKESTAQALCFDHIIPKRHVVDALLTVAKNMSIPTIALPHGVYLYTNEFTKAKATPSRRFEKFNRFDYVIVQNQLRKDVLARSGVAEEKIFVLGSARFCGEWIAQNKNILPRVLESNAKSRGRLKVVFMTSKPQCRIDVERMSTTFKLLSDLHDVETMIKPHTRFGAVAHLFGNLPLTDASAVLSAELCEWADVVLVIGTSVMTEALMQGKPVLYLKYLHGNTMLFEECGACWTIHDEAELVDAIESLRTRRMALPYPEENVDRFLSEVVYGGRNKREVLEDYVHFITNRTGS